MKKSEKNSEKQVLRYGVVVDDDGYESVRAERDKAMPPHVTRTHQVLR